MRKYNKGDKCYVSESSEVVCEIIGSTRDDNKHVYYKVRPVCNVWGYSVVRFLKLANAKRAVYIRGDRLSAIV